LTKLEAFEMRLIWSCGSIGFICIDVAASDAEKLSCPF
jgi:hypothetical protein